MDVTKPYRFIRFGAMDVTKPFEFKGFGAMDVTKPYKFIGFGAEHTGTVVLRIPSFCVSIFDRVSTGFTNNVLVGCSCTGELPCKRLKPYGFLGFGGHGGHQTL